MINVSDGLVLKRSIRVQVHDDIWWYDVLAKLIQVEEHHLWKCSCRFRQDALYGDVHGFIATPRKGGSNPLSLIRYVRAGFIQLLVVRGNDGQDFEHGIHTAECACSLATKSPHEDLRPAAWAAV
jgi:hypothetical protein